MLEGEVEEVLPLGGAGQFDDQLIGLLGGELA